MRKIYFNQSTEKQLAEEFLKFSEEITERKVEWGTGKDRGSFTARLVIDVKRFSLFSV